MALARAWSLSMHRLLWQTFVAIWSITSIERRISTRPFSTTDVLIVNYHRAAVGQVGGGHISPLGAYDTGTDSVLVLDVNPSHYPWVWMPIPTLIQGMRTRDVLENRGYILVQSL